MKIIDALNTSYPVASLDDSLDSVSMHFLNHEIDYVPVIDNEGNIFGVLSSTTLAETLAQEVPPQGQAAWEICEREFVKAQHPEDSFGATLERFQSSELVYVVVTEHDRYIGLLSAADVMKSLQIKSEDEAKASIELETETPAI